MSSFIENINFYSFFRCQSTLMQLRTLPSEIFLTNTEIKSQFHEKIDIYYLCLGRSKAVIIVVLGRSYKHLRQLSDSAT